MRLVWDGHEFLDAARDERRWKKVQESIASIGGVPFAIVQTALVEMARQEIDQHLVLTE